MTLNHIPLVGALLLMCGTPILAAPAVPDPFAENIRLTPWQSPADEQKSLRVPEGFEVQLVAAEPQSISR